MDGVMCNLILYIKRKEDASFIDYEHVGIG